MKLSDLGAVRKLNERRIVIQEQLADIDNNRVNLTVGSYICSGELREVVKDAMFKYFEKQLNENKRELAALGVKV